LAPTAAPEAEEEPLKAHKHKKSKHKKVMANSWIHLPETSACFVVKPSVS